jgi:hypothetical protein
VEELAQLERRLLEDVSEEQVTSRQGLEDFLRHVVTLLEGEQRAIDGLRVPATDSHTVQAFDCSIGEAVRDGLANKICLHKTGDLIGQANRNPASATTQTTPKWLKTRTFQQRITQPS